VAGDPDVAWTYPEKLKNPPRLHPSKIIEPERLESKVLSSDAGTQEFMAWLQGNPPGATVAGQRSKSAQTQVDGVSIDVADQCLTCGSHLSCKEGERKSGGKCIPIVSI